MDDHREPTGDRVVETAVRARAVEVATAAGCSAVTFGVRAADGSVFAVCGGVESDGATFADALAGVVAKLKAQADAGRERARRILEESERIAGL